MRLRFAALVVTIAAFGGLVRAQDRATTENVRLVATGEIRKVDQKSKTFQFKITLDRPTFGGYGRGGGNPGGPGGRGGAGRRGGGRYPGGAPDRPTVQGIPESIEVKVFVSPNTVIRGDQEGFNFSNLKMGQHVSVTGIHKGTTGTDIDAIEVQR